MVLFKNIPQYEKMVDHVTKEKRSQIMAAVRGKDTAPEYAIRKLLHAAGYRYRLHGKTLLGKPAIVLRKYHAVIFVHGCFWHGHDCHLSKTLPKTRRNFWENKISTNKQRDENNINLLFSQAWRVCLIWECALIRRGKIDEGSLLKILSGWIKSKKTFLNIVGFISEDQK